MVFRHAFTLVEVLISVAIIASLIAILLPAVNSARESARRTACQNHLRQSALASESHVSAHGHYPTGGWGFIWRGDPDRGFGAEQPGGWIYNLLPYVEQTDLREIGRGLSKPEKMAALRLLLESNLELFRCPTRGGAPLSAFRSTQPPRNAPELKQISKTDYAINAGDRATDVTPGPESMKEGDAQSSQGGRSVYDGVSFPMSRVRPSQVIDGASQTYLLGEKHVSLTSAHDWGYDQSMFSGFDYDIARWGAMPPKHDKADIDFRAFGSAHYGGFQMVRVDGSTHFVSYDIDLHVHRRFANRRDNGR